MASLGLSAATTPNLAPADGLRQAAADAGNDRSIEVEAGWFREEFKRLDQEERAVWDAEALKWALIFFFIEGKMLLRRSKYSNGWYAVEAPQRTDIPVYGFNLTGFYSESIRANWTNSNTDIRWLPMRDMDDARGAAKGAQAVRNHLRRKLYTYQFRQLESLLAQAGKYARYYYYDEGVKSYARRPRIEEQQLQFGESAYLCPECGSSGLLGAGSSEMGGAVPAPVASDQQIPGQLDTDGSAQAGMAGAQGGLSDIQTGTATLHSNLGPSFPFDPDGRMAVRESLQSGSATLEQEGRHFTTRPVSFMGEMRVDVDPVEESVSPPGPTCPDCGSPNIEVEAAEPFTIESVTGYDEIETGSIVCEPVPPFELKHDLQKHPHESPYLIRRRRVRVSILQDTFQFLNIKPSSSDNQALNIADTLKRSTYSGSGSNSRGNRTSANDEPTAEFTQVWLEPCMYSRLRLKEDLRTVSGTVIPAGTLLADVFKTGLYMCFVEGVDGVIELRDECHKEFWVGGVLRPRANSSLGNGIEDMIEGNRQLNLIYSIIYAQLRTAAMPATLFDERLLPNGVSSYIGSLDNIPVNLAALDDKRLSDAVHQLQPQPPSSQHFGYAQKLHEYIQLASRVTDFSGGLPGVNNETATGAELTVATGQKLFAPQLSGKAEVDRVGAEIELKLYKKYCIDEQYITLQGRRGEQDGMWLAASNINTDMYAEVVPDSYLPQTNLERRERWDAFLQRVGGLPGLKAALQQAPDQVAELADIFDVDLAGEDFEAWAELCREHIEQMKQALPMLQMMQQGMPPTQMAADPVSGEMMEVPVDPMAEAASFLLGVLQPPIEPEQLGHLACIQYLRAWRTTDEGKKAPPELWAGVKAIIYARVEGLMAEAQLMGMVAMAGMPPEEQMSAGGESPKVGEKNKNKQSKQMQPGAAQSVGASV